MSGDAAVMAVGGLGRAGTCWDVLGRVGAMETDRKLGLELRTTAGLLSTRHKA